MATISWKQIDVNGNGYVDETEPVTAKAMGVKNVWYGMTQSDFMSNTTRDKKLSMIKNYFGEFDGLTRINCYIGDDAEIRRAEDKKAKENELIVLYNKYEKYVKEHAGELEQLEKQMSVFKSGWNLAIANLKEFCNEYLNTSFDSTKERKRVEDDTKAINSYSAIQREIDGMQCEMNRLINEINPL